MKKEHPPNTAKRLIVFSACPRYLLDDVGVTSDKTRKWLSENGFVRDGNFKFNFLPPTGRPRINLNSLTYKWFRQDQLTRYVEFQNNGYLEEGITDPIIREVPFRGNYADMHAGLNLNWATGAYWAFLLFARNYYNFHQIFDEIIVSFNIHNTTDLMLFGFAGSASANTRWAEPVEGGYLWELPYTENLNVQVTDSVNAFTPIEEIARIVRKVSDKLSNAYGMEKSRCYNIDGTFEHGLFSAYDPT